MKRKNKLLVMLAVLIVLVLGTAAAAHLTEKAKVVDPEADDVVIFGVEPESVTAISWTYGGETYAAVLQEEVWCSAEDSSVLLDSTYLEEMTAQLSSVVACRTIEDPGTLSDYGLREPSCTVCVNNLDELTLFLGNETGIGGQYYCSIDDGKVYLVDASVMDAFSCSLDQITAEEETTKE